MDKDIFQKIKEQAKRLDIVGYDYSVEPPNPIYTEKFDEEKFAELILSEAIYIGGSLITDVEPQYEGKITVHEISAWQRAMRNHFSLKE
jgi:hypothetical protein